MWLDVHLPPPPGRARRQWTVGPRNLGYLKGRKGSGSGITLTFSRLTGGVMSDSDSGSRRPPGCLPTLLIAVLRLPPPARYINKPPPLYAYRRSRSLLFCLSFASRIVVSRIYRIQLPASSSSNFLAPSSPTNPLTQQRVHAQHRRNGSPRKEGLDWHHQDQERSAQLPGLFFGAPYSCRADDSNKGVGHDH